MFSRYWRSYPYLLQAVLFGLMVFTLMSFGNLLGLALVPKITGIPLKDIVGLGPDSSMAVSKTALWLNAVLSFVTFAAPCLLFAYLATPRPAQYLGLQRPRNRWQPLWVIGLMLGYLLISVPLENFIGAHVHLPKSVQDADNALNRMNQGLLKFNSPADLFRILFVLALLVPLGEELMFRGMLMRFAARRAKSVHLPIILTSVLFAFMHQNPVGLIFILIAGFLLGSIFWRTGSLWCCVLGHAVYNGTQILMQYISSRAPAGSHSGDMPSYLIAIGALLMAGCGYWLYKSSSPLPVSWAQDFNEAELQANSRGTSPDIDSKNPS